jgi:hypothetical protein
MWEKIKLLLKIRKPAEDVSNDIKEIKRGWKTLSFWLVLIGHLGSLVAAAQGVLDPKLALILNTILAVLYNILRGVNKSQEEGVREWWKTTEVWMSVGSQLSAGSLALQQGGINPAWLVTASTVLNAVLALSRDLSHKQPEQPNESGK